MSGKITHSFFIHKTFCRKFCKKKQDLDLQKNKSGSIKKLIATIDRVPCTIQLTPTVAEAYRAGALPLNTLANAVLAKSDQLRHIASQNYDDGQRETVVRTRGIQ